MPAAAANDDLFEAFFDLSLTGALLLAPVPDAAGQVADFRYVRLNLAAQRLLNLPEQPAESFLTRYPPALPTGIFAFYREAYLAGEARQAEFNYQHDGRDTHCRLAARRVGDRLLVSFADTSGEQPRPALEQALRESQAREQATRAEVEAERLRLYQVLRRIPASIALLRGPEHTYTFVNPEYTRLFPDRSPLGCTIREFIPELAGQGFYELFDRVYETGEPFYDAETEARANLAGASELPRRYYRTALEPIRDAQGQVTEVLSFAVDVTEQVAARQRIEQLSQELEARVQARTGQLEAARAATERRRWEELFRHAPVAICIFDGPEWVYEYINPGYQAMFPGRDLLGKRLVDALPEVRDQPLMDILHRVYDTGEPFEASEVLVPLARTAGGPIEDIYFDLTYQARRNEAGQIDGFITYAHDVTEQVNARRQTDALQAALLAAAQHQVQQREELFQVFEQAPAAIALLREPHHRIEYVNPAYQQFFPGVALRGRRLTEAHPGSAADGTLARLDQVYATGEPYVGEEVPLELVLEPGQPAQLRYFNFTYQAYRENERIVGVSIFASDVTNAVLMRRAAAEGLARQQQELERIFEQAPVAITILRGPELVIELANAAMSRLWGRPASTTVGRPHFEAIPETVGQGFQELLLRVLRTGQPLDITGAPVQLARGAGGQPETAYVNFTFQPLRNEHGTTTGLVAVGTEVTEQVLARQQVEQLNQELEARVQARTRELEAARAATERERLLLQALFAQAPVAIALYQGPELTVASANERMAALWGRTPAQVLGRPLLAGVPELRGQGFDDLLRQVLATQVPYLGSEAPATMLRNGELTTTYYNFVYQPLYNAAGEVLGVINVAVEVTEQVLARQQVEQLNQELEARVQARTRELEAARAATERERLLLQQVLSQAPAYVAIFTGPSHRFLFVNQEYEQVLTQGRARVGYAVAELFPELVEQGFLGVLDRVYASGQVYYDPAARLVQRNPATGLERTNYIEATYQPLRDEQGQVFGVLAFANDVTEQVLARRQVEEVRVQVQTLNEELATTNEELRATNEELQESNAQLTHTNADLDTFVYTASHDLKAPITNIEGLVLALRQELPAPAAAEPLIQHLLELIEKSVGRFLQTIGQLTDVSRIQQVAQEPAEAVDLASLLDDIRLDLAPLFDSTRAQMRYNLDACPTVLFPPKNLRSIFYNLVSNALKYRDPARRPVVWVRAARVGQQVVLEVQDNGLGLNETQQSNLFVLFKRLHTHVEGSGVGLYMLRRIVENARGTITVRSEVGLGSTFTITLPRSSPAA